jgi:hypothetical protein
MLQERIREHDVAAVHAGRETTRDPREHDALDAEALDEHCRGCRYRDLADAQALGVRRISVGGALARSAWGGFMRASKAIAEEGRFDTFALAASGVELNSLMRGR